MFKVDREKFFQRYRCRFGTLSADLVAATEFLLDRIEKDARFPGGDAGRRQIAYCLATFKWETAHAMRPIDEHGSEEYFESRYGPSTRVGKQLGNTERGDGDRFHGRGYVQLTGRNNYDRAGKTFNIDLISEPERAKDPEIAYNIAIQGMKEGWFTGKRLAGFFENRSFPDYEGARAIFNDLDKAQLIGDMARRFNEILHVCRVTSEVEPSVGFDSNRIQISPVPHASPFHRRAGTRPPQARSLETPMAMVARAARSLPLPRFASIDLAFLSRLMHLRYADRAD